VGRSSLDAWPTEQRINSNVVVYFYHVPRGTYLPEGTDENGYRYAPLPLNPDSTPIYDYYKEVHIINAITNPPSANLGSDGSVAHVSRRFWKDDKWCDDPNVMTLNYKDMMCLKYSPALDEWLMS